MYASILYDVGGALVAFGVGLIIPTLIIAVVEAVVMFLLKWGNFRRSLWISLLMNVTSTIFGIGGVLVGSFTIFTDISIWLAVAIAFLLSVLIEGAVLLLSKRNAVRLNWSASLIANIASYLLVILPLAWLINS